MKDVCADEGRQIHPLSRNPIVSFCFRAKGIALVIIFPRKSAKHILQAPVPQTDTRGRVEHTKALRDSWLRNFFTLLIEVLFTFPSQYWFTIGLTGVFSLTGWSRRIRAGFHVSRVTQEYAKPQDASHTGLSPSMVHSSIWFRSHPSCL